MKRMFCAVIIFFLISLNASASFDMKSETTFTTANSLSSTGTDSYEFVLPEGQTEWRFVVNAQYSVTLYLRQKELGGDGSIIADIAQTSAGKYSTLLVTENLTAGAAYVLTVKNHAKLENTYSLSAGTQAVFGLDWDPGSESPTNIATPPDATGGDYLYKFTSQSSAYAAMRFVVEHNSGPDIDLYVSPETVPTMNVSSRYKSEREGGDGLVLDNSYFEDNQTWYVLIHQKEAGTPDWSLYAGDIYVQELEELGEQLSSDSVQTVGPEGQVFYRTTVIQLQSAVVAAVGG